MSDKKLELSRRNMLAGLGTIGIASAGAGMGTSAYFNDREVSEENTVTAGKLDLKIDWWQRYWQDGAEPENNGSESDLRNNPGPIFNIGDVKPGDCGCGLISLHVFDNPAYIFGGCHLEEEENGRTEPEKDDDNTPNEGELAENIEIALLKFPLIKDTNAQASEQTDYQTAMEDTLKGDRDMQAMANSTQGCQLIHRTTLEEFCNNSDNYWGSSHLLDGSGYSLDDNTWKDGTCFMASHTYFYAFCWWIPKSVENEIQTDSATFDLKFGAVQCRHLDKEDAPDYNPFDGEGESADTQSTATETAT